MTAEERKQKVQQAIANEELEGLTVPPETRKALDDYVSGKMTLEEASAQVYSRYGVA